MNIHDRRDSDATLLCWQRIPVGAVAEYNPSGDKTAATYYMRLSDGTAVKLDNGSRLPAGAMFVGAVYRRIEVEMIILKNM